MDQISVLQMMKHHWKLKFITFLCILVADALSKKTQTKNKDANLKNKNELINKNVNSQNDYGLMYDNDDKGNAKKVKPNFFRSKKKKKHDFDEDDLQNLFKRKKNKSKKKGKKKGSDYMDGNEEDDFEDYEEIIIVDEPKPIIQGCKMIHK